MNKKFLIILLALILAALLFLRFSKNLRPIIIVPSPSGIPTPLVDIKTEANCTDKIDNDGDGLVDGADGDCWIKEGAIYETHPYYYPNHSFKEITADIPRIKELGAKTIYLMPIWERAMKKQDTTLIYLINDYYKIDPIYGTTDDLRELVKAAHQNDMKILFDLVACCTPKGSVTYNNNWTYNFTSEEFEEKAKEMDWKPEYKTVEGRNFVIAGEHKVIEGRNLYDFAGEIDGAKIVVWAFPMTYWGPAVDLGNPDVIKYYTGVAEYYVKKYDIDGWRIDAPANNYNPKVFPGNHSSVKLLTSAINAVKKIKPNAEFISEPGLAKEVPANLLYNNLPRVMPDIIENTITSSELVNKLEKGFEMTGKMNLFVAESHDQIRLNKSYPESDKNFLVLISTLPGVPFIQTGQEIGSKNDWFRSRNPNPQVDWIKADESLNDFYKKVINFRSSSNPLKYGDIKNVWKSGDKTYAYSRTYENETVIVIISFKSKESTSILNLPFKQGTILSDELNNEQFTVSDPSGFKVSVPAYGSRVLIVKK